jgi:hypothetical protein
MDSGFGFVDTETFSYERAWQGGATATEELSGIISAEDPSYWMVPGVGGAGDVTQWATTASPTKEAALRPDGFLQDDSFYIGERGHQSGQDFLSERLKSKGYDVPCCGSCAAGGSCEGGCGGGCSCRGSSQASGGALAMGGTGGGPQFAGAGGGCDPKFEHNDCCELPNKYPTDPTGGTGTVTPDDSQFSASGAGGAGWTAEDKEMCEECGGTWSDSDCPPYYWEDAWCCVQVVCMDFADKRAIAFSNKNKLKWQVWHCLVQVIDCWGNYHTYELSHNLNDALAGKNPLTKPDVGDETKVGIWKDWAGKQSTRKLKVGDDITWKNKGVKSSVKVRWTSEWWCEYCEPIEFQESEPLCDCLVSAAATYPLSKKSDHGKVTSNCNTFAQSILKKCDIFDKVQDKQDKKGGSAEEGWDRLLFMGKCAGAKKQKIKKWLR